LAWPCLQGYIGQPVGGFPEPLRTRVLKGKGAGYTGRPGSEIPDQDLEELQTKTQLKHEEREVTWRDTMSAAMYPDVFDDYVRRNNQYGPITCLPTKAFLVGLDIDEEIEFDFRTGVKVSIKLKAIGELRTDGNRDVFFEINGIPRTVEIADKTDDGVGDKRRMAVREKSDAADLGSVGAPMAGSVVEVLVAAGEQVAAGQALVVLSAMKMETTVSAPCAGRLRHVAAVQGRARPILLDCSPRHTTPCNSGNEASRCMSTTLTPNIWQALAPGDTCSAGDLLVAIEAVEA